MTDGMLQDLSDYIKSGILKLQDTWEIIGISDSEQNEKCDSVVTSLKSVLDSLIIGENAWKLCLEEECEVLSERCNDSFKQLGLPVFNHLSITLALMSKRDFLTNKNRELEIEIEAKKEKIASLETYKIECITRLGLQQDHYPTIQSDNLARIISLLEVEIKEFEDDMSRRTKTLNSQLNELSSLVDGLELNRAYLIEEGLLSDDPDTLLLSDESIRRREDLITKYKELMIVQKRELADVRNSIERLHKLLYPGQDLAEDITDNFDCPKPSVIKYLKKVLESLEAEKAIHITTYTQRLEEEIERYQKLCFQTKCEPSFEKADNISVSDLILENIENKDSNNPDVKLHHLEADLEAWECFYKSNRFIFDMVAKWKDLNDRYLELQAPTPDKYNNRGGALLQSQKESSRISKEIPRLESKILTEVDKLNGEEIRINDYSIEDYFSEYRATTTLNRIQTIRKSKRKSIKKGEQTPTDTKASKRTLRRRVSKESGLENVGLK